MSASPEAPSPRANGPQKHTTHTHTTHRTPPIPTPPTHTTHTHTDTHPAEGGCRPSVAALRSFGLLTEQCPAVHTALRGRKSSRLRSPRSSSTACSRTSSTSSYSIDSAREGAKFVICNLLYEHRLCRMPLANFLWNWHPPV